jgi:hypothetical protein
MLAPVFNFLNTTRQTDIIDNFLTQSNSPCMRFNMLNNSMLQGLP